MKKRIFRSLCGVALLVTALTAALCMWSFYHLMLDQARTDLAGEYDIIIKGFAEAQKDDLDYVGVLDRQFFRTRMTLVDREGKVLYDSQGKENVTENHGARPEIINAFAFGVGEDVRNSETTGQSTFYYARQLDKEHVLRISKPTRIIGTEFWSVLPVILVILLLIGTAGAWLASRLTELILRPIRNLPEQIEGDVRPDYEELEPFFIRIRDQNALIRQQMETVREERDTIRAITSNMQEGLILMNLSRHVLSVNRSALSLLDRHGDGEERWGLSFSREEPSTFEGRHILNVARDAELMKCVDSALAGKPSDGILMRGDRACRVLASPVNDDQNAVCGAMVLLLDVTEQQKTERIRREFSANVSHELKTPLTSISGFAELMETGMASEPADVKKFAARIHEEARRLISLTDDIIRLSRIEMDGALETEQVDLWAVCESTVRNLGFVAEQKQVELKLLGEQTFLQANERMMEELVFNLADNGIKYNQSGGLVELSVRAQGEDVLLSVKDTGIGIPKEHQERIFERFYRVDKSRSKQTGGTGLGLSIVRHIVERHGGVVTLDSRQGEGTTVTVRLPK